MPMLQDGGVISGEFRAILIIVGFLAVVSLAVSRTVRGESLTYSKSHSRWVRRHGFFAEFISSVTTMVCMIACIFWAVLREVEPTFGALIIPIVLFFPSMNSVRGFLDWGRQRSWIWVIRKGETFRQRAHIGMFLVILGLLIFAYFNL